jgi:dTDP-4-dehydrorhamnose reductase
MKVCILGSTGMLGIALSKEAARRNIPHVGVARKKASISLNIGDERSLIDFFAKEDFDIVINAAAIVDHDLCESSPELAYMVNARPVSIILECIRDKKTYFIQISTDGYFSGDGRKKHGENSPVTLLNEYARTKFAAEAFALSNQRSMVVRTNIVGFRNTKKATFIEWIMGSLKGKKNMILLDDYFVSSISVSYFSKSLFDLIEKRISGIVNLASRDVFSKAEFIIMFAKKFRFDLGNATVGSVKTSLCKRAESLGLDVTKAEKVLGYALPTLEEVVLNLKGEYLAL